ncbi:hypothetical protein D3C81_1912590 [compost metagenome]
MAGLLELGVADGVDGEPVRVGEGVVVDMGLVLGVIEMVGPVGHLRDEPWRQLAAKQVAHIGVQQGVAAAGDEIELPLEGALEQAQGMAHLLEI